MWLYGAGGVLVALLFWLVFRERPRDHPWCNAAEADLVEAGRPASTRAAGQGEKLPLGAMMSSLSLWLSSFSQLTTNFGWVFLVTWLPRYLVEVHHVPVRERGWMAAVPLQVVMATDRHHIGGTPSCGAPP